MSVNNEIEGDSPKEIMMGSLVVHREVPTRVGVVCLPAFKINKVRVLGCSGRMRTTLGPILTT